MPGVTVERGGLRIGGELVPLLSGSVQYWRIEPPRWRACLEATRGMGMRFVELYVPWGVHELGKGRLELGERDPQRDVCAFLRLAHELGLYAIVRPGPHINAELTYFGLPERIVWDAACQARSPNGNAVILAAPPKMFPVPSYASDAYRDEVTRYFHLLGERLAPLLYPEGPIALLQIDNEGALFFRDGAYDQDYHPDALAKYRAFVREKYGTMGALARAYGMPEEAAPTFSELLPPRAFDAKNTDELLHYLDWAEFQEQMLADALAGFRAALEEGGLGGVPTMHNFPLAQEATPLNAARVGEIVDFVGLDYYGRAGERARRDIARRTSELTVVSDAMGRPSFACEMGAGYPPVFPPLAEGDSLFTAMAALAYGLRGFNLYMAVERDRWIGAPIDPHGRARPFAESWRRLAEALERTRFHELVRRVPVRIVVPRIERRLARLMHAFGPASGALLSVLGQGPREACLEDDLGLGYPLAIEVDTFVRSFEDALEARGVPFAVVGGEHRKSGLEGAQWIVCATSVAFSSELALELLAARRRGAEITIGPHPLAFDGAFKPAQIASELLAQAELVECRDPAAADQVVSARIASLGLPSFASDPDVVFATVHEDAAGEARVVFVLNPTGDDLVARTTLGVDATWLDMMTGRETRSERGVLEIRMRPRTVRMLARG